MFFRTAMEFHARLTSHCGNPILERFHKLISELNALPDQLPEYQRESDYVRGLGDS